jgi:MurNAc alpha-1-phosphate uridylyltransferase
MHAMILAAGFGTRMQDLTQQTPKPLLKVGNTTLIEHNIKKLLASGVEKIIINTHYLSEKIISHLQNYNEVIFTKEQKILNSGGGIINALDFLTDKFIVINCDVLSDYDLSNLNLSPNKLAKLILVDNPDHNPNGDFEYNNEKLTFSGIGIYNKKLFVNYPLKSIALATIIRDNLADIEFAKYEGFWLDVGTRERLKIADNYLKALAKES